MRIEQKKNTLSWLLLAILVWPLFHHVAVVTLDIDKWSFLGFSMYITKRPIYVYSPQDIRLFDNDGRPLPVSSLDLEQYRELGQLIKLFERERATYGGLYRQDRFAHQALAALPQIGRFSFGFSELRMNRTTAVFEGTRWLYVARREGQGGNVESSLQGQPIKHAASHAMP